MTNRTLALTLVLVLATGALCAAAETASGVVNVNTADIEQLQLLPRVGPALAQRIIDYREANGVFQSSDELVAVKGIGEKSLKNLRPYLTTSGETTLDAKVTIPRKSSSAGA